MSDNENNTLQNTFTTATGYTVTLRPVHHTKITSAMKKVERQFREDGRQVDIPTYAAEGEFAGDQVFAFDQKYVDEMDDPEITERWEDYLSTQIELMSAKRERELKTMFRLGTDFQMPEDDSWIEEHIYDGLEVPDHPIEQLEHFLFTEVFVTLADIKAFNLKLVDMATDGLDPDAKEAVMDSFRDTMEAAEGEAVEDLTDTEGKLVSQ